MTSKESDKIFDDATRIAGAYRAEHKTDREWPPIHLSQHEAAKLYFEPEVSDKKVKEIKSWKLDDPVPIDRTTAFYLGRAFPDEPTVKSSLPDDSAARKTYPMCSGLLDYFTAALAEVAHISYLGNEKHNPGEPLHHARGKSMDHADCIIRHLAERGTRDAEGNRHTAQMAWRALALLQEELEKDLGLPLPRGARCAP